MKNFNIILGLVILFILAIGLGNEAVVSDVYNAKVIDKQQQNIISGTNGNLSTTIRYLVITDKGTFVCESSIINGKFNNSDIYFRIQKDSTYSFIVAGIGKTILTDYKNILRFK